MSRAPEWPCVRMLIQTWIPEINPKSAQKEAAKSQPVRRGTICNSLTHFAVPRRRSAASCAMSAASG